MGSVSLTQHSREGSTCNQVRAWQALPSSASWTPGSYSERGRGEVRKEVSSSQAWYVSHLFTHSTNTIAHQLCVLGQSP